MSPEAVTACAIDITSEDKLLASDGAANDQFGHRVAGAGDVDGDGYDDVVVGAYNDVDGGSVYIYYGGCRDQDYDGNDAPADETDDGGGCGGCAEGATAALPSGAGFLLVLGLLWLRRRRSSGESQRLNGRR